MVLDKFVIKYKWKFYFYTYTFLFVEFFLNLKLLLSIFTNSVFISIFVGGWVIVIYRYEMCLMLPFKKNEEVMFIQYKLVMIKMYNWLKVI